MTNDMLGKIMRILIIIFLLIFSFNSNSATVEENCKKALSIVNEYGFNLSKYKPGEKQTRLGAALYCCTTEENYRIIVTFQAQRISVTDISNIMSKSACIKDNGQMTWVYDVADCYHK